MKLLGKNGRVARFLAKYLLPTSSGGRWYTIHDTHAGAWQQDYTSVEMDSMLTFSAVFACVRLITSDIGKLGIRLVRLNGGIWEEFESPLFSPVLKKPNPYQTRIKFFEQWVTSKLLHGNTYVLKGRDNRGVVTSLRVLDPIKVQALISNSGEVFYRLRTDHLNTVHEEITVPSTEIIHDVHVTPEHPLVGVTPLGACGLAALQGIKIQENSQKFFGNLSRPGGMLTAPGAISDETAARLKASFETNFGGDNIGKLAVAGDGLEFKAFTVNAQDSQLIEQLKWTAEDVCRAFGVPPYKIGVGQPPAYNNINALDQAYYSETLQELIECIELLLDEGLSLPDNIGTEFDLEDLLRMDSLTRTQVLAEKIKAGYLAPNEARAKDGYQAVQGGETPYLQQQNWSLAALSRRDTNVEEAGADVQAEALNGAQITALQGLIVAASAGEIPVETISSAIAAAFPLLTDEQIAAMVAPISVLLDSNSDDLEGDDLESALDDELDEEMVA